MSTAYTKKSKVWKYFDHIDRDKTFSKAKCKLCSYSTDYNGTIRPLWNHLSRHKDEIKQFEGNSRDTNTSLSSRNRTKKTGDAATIIEAVDTTVTNNDYKRRIKTKNIRRAEPTIEKNSSNSIRAFLNHIRNYLDSLEKLNMPVGTWDMTLQIRPKVNRNTRLHYKGTLKSDNNLTLTQLLEFLTERAKCDTTTVYSIPNHEQASNSQRSSERIDFCLEQNNYLLDYWRNRLSLSSRPSTSKSQTIQQSSSRRSISRPSSTLPIFPRLSSPYRFVPHHIDCDDDL